MKFKKLLILLLGVAPFLPSSASALVMRENGPEPIIVQIKESLRQSDDLDNRLSQLATTHNQNGLSVVKWWAGRKLLVMLSFPANFSEQRALTVIERLEQLPAVEKVVAASAYNLEFKPADFARAYNPTETIPNVARRGLDRKRFNRPAYVPPDREDLAHMPHATNRLIVRWKDEFIWRAAQTGFLQQMADLHQATGCRVVRDVQRSGTRLSQVLEFDGNPDALADKLRRYMNSGWVEYAQPDIMYHATSGTATPNDPVYNAYPGPQWSLPIIHGPEAWSLPQGSQGDPSVIIAVADSGAPVNAAPLFPGVTPHPDFQDPSHTLWNIWSGQNTNVPGEYRNFHDQNNDVSDDWDGVWHGTRVASIIGARGNNALGMSGVAWNVSLMILKVLGACGTFGGCSGLGDQEAFSSSVSGAVLYASRYHATAINCSFSGLWRDKDNVQRYDPDVTAAIDTVREDGGMLIVASAVNASGNNDENQWVNTPQLLPLDNVISVGATTIDDQKASYSNYGIYRVDLGAPGGDSNGGPTILGLKSTFNGNSFDPANYTFGSGTSFAAPHVSGAVALVKSKYLWENYLGVKDRILMGVDHALQFNTQFRTKGRLNLFRALHKRTLIRNISTRAYVGTGEQVLIGGFRISGEGDPGAPLLKVCVRGLGPSVGVSPVLVNPKIQIFSSSGKPNPDDINDNWGTDVNHNQLAGYGLEPTNTLEAAMIRDLAPGAYTVVVSASPGTSLGIGLVEIYELSNGMSERSRLVNLSTRCFAGTGNYAAIAGTIVGDPVDDPALPDRRILMLGRGPSLSNAGISNPLPDPALELHDSSGALMESNNTWTDIDGPYLYFDQPPLIGRIQSGNALEGELASAGFFDCVSTSPQEPCYYSAGSTLESVLWPTLRSGAYTAILTPNGATSNGVGLIEFYEY